jgi:hypothetical protein
LNRGLEPVSKPAPLWFGEGVHFALKDFHGPKQHSTLVDSFKEFTDASMDLYPDRLPPETPELLLLGPEMLRFYEEDWLERRDPLTTYVLDGIPQVEVAFEIELPIDPHLLSRINKRKVVYRGTFDRISIDDYGMLWIVEYKTAKQLDTYHLLTDPQVTAYCWAAACVYKLPIAGVIYQQHKKVVPKPARILKNGNISVAKNQVTSHKIYKAALTKVYGAVVNKWSPEHVETLNMLAQRESWDHDAFIKRTKISRNEFQIGNEGRKILLEVHEMLNPDTPMYASPNWMCGWCDFQSACVSMDDGSDFEQELNDEGLFRVRHKASSEWELLAHEKLGGILHHSKASVTHDRSGAPIENPDAAGDGSPSFGGDDGSSTTYGSSYNYSATKRPGSLPAQDASDEQWDDWIERFDKQLSGGDTDGDSHPTEG